ncbi:hypothetical protein ABVK25_002114 [Lepraria finkii]|uniref:Uncharacterized protein n=1 Tax=Lepraria finkii TaxID=1340010 RepID=A0ABR4BJ22_9LECA
MLDFLARDCYNNAAKAVGHKALADDNQLDAWDLENLLTVALRIKSPEKLNSYILVDTFLFLSFDEDFDTLREEFASAFYDEVDREPRSSELPEMRISYDVRMTESSLLIRETLSRELHRLNEQVKQRKLGAITAIMPDENPKRDKSQDTAAHKNLQCVDSGRGYP